MSRHVFVDVPGLGLSAMAVPPEAVDRLLAATYLSVDPPDARRYVNALVSHTLVSPRRLSYDDVDVLP